jgi:hypothetical protein
LGGSLATTVVSGGVSTNVGASGVTWDVGDLAISAAESSSIT